MFKVIHFDRGCWQDYGAGGMTLPQARNVASAVRGLGRPAKAVEEGRHHCKVCGCGIGWNRPSGVCSQECLDKGQGFTK